MEQQTPVSPPQHHSTKPKRASSFPQVKLLSCNRPQHVVRLFVDARIQILQLQSVCRKHSPLRQVFDSISPLGVGRFASRGMILVVSNGQSTSAKTALHPASMRGCSACPLNVGAGFVHLFGAHRSTSTPTNCVLKQPAHVDGDD